MGTNIYVSIVIEGNGRRVVARKQNKSLKCVGEVLTLNFTEHANILISVKANNYEMEEVMVWFPHTPYEKFRLTYRKA